MSVQLDMIETLLRKQGDNIMEIHKTVVGGIPASHKLVVAARRVVWARYYNGDDGWEKLNEAIGQLEDIVGRPKSIVDVDCNP